MHPCYAVYVFVCCCQPALFVLSQSLEHHVVVPCLQDMRLDSTVCLCCILTSCFAVLYILTLRSNDDYCFLQHDDDDSAQTMIENGGATVGVQTLELGRHTFWAFFCMHASIISMLSCSAVDTDHLHILVAARIASAWTLCRTGRSLRGRAPLIIGFVLYAFWAYSCRTRALILCQVILDALLFLGHRWDLHPNALVVLNCRLFFVACVCSTLMAAAFLL
jgi:hypothetical protein